MIQAVSYSIKPNYTTRWGGKTPALTSVPELRSGVPKHEIRITIPRSLTKTQIKKELEAAIRQFLHLAVTENDVDSACTIFAPDADYARVHYKLTAPHAHGRYKGKDGILRFYYELGKPTAGPGPTPISSHSPVTPEPAVLTGKTNTFIEVSSAGRSYTAVAWGITYASNDTSIPQKPFAAFKDEWSFGPETPDSTQFKADYRRSTLFEVNTLPKAKANLKAYVLEVARNYRD
jgi:hypothetical protein